MIPACSGFSSNFMSATLLRGVVFSAIALISGFHVSAQTQDSVPASFIRDFYHNGDFVHYIEALNDHIVYQGNHSGQWSNPDRLLLSINGNPFYMNRYYYDGIRLDDRFNPGSTLYVPNLEHYDMVINTTSSAILLSHDNQDANYAMAQGNFGGLGGVSPGSEKIIHIFHRAGWEGAYKPELSIPYRPHIRHAFTVDAALAKENEKGSLSRQHIYATYGSRTLPKYDGDGLIDLSPTYNSPYYKVQFDGSRRINDPVIKELGYFFNVSGKNDYNSELYYNWEEVAKLFTLSATLYGKGGIGSHRVNSALTYSLNNVKHANLSFSRNIVDQDGESFEPWQPDGNTHELTWFVGYEKRLNPRFKLKGEFYNSLMIFRPSASVFQNETFLKLPDPIESHFPDGDFVPVVHEKIPLMTYHWQSSPFTGGLLDNRFGVEYSQDFSHRFLLKGNLSATLDAFLLRESRSKVSPNFIANVEGAYMSPHFNISVKLSHDRVRYNYDDIRFFSVDYLNGEAFSDATGKLMLTTGGKYRDMKRGLKQTAFVSAEIPIVINFGKKRRHEIALIQSYRKYYNVWNTYFDGDPSQYGHFTDGVFFYNPGEKHYSVGYLPKGIMGDNFFTRTPYYLSQLTRYTFQSSKVFVSVSWQSMQFGSTSALGNGPVSNNIGALSESTANPNTFTVASNPGPYAAAGRADQDKAFIFRCYAAYNVSKWLQLGINAKWTDGQPFTSFHTVMETDADGNRQVAVIPAHSRGTNPIDGDFGSRENAIFNIDLHARCRWTYLKHNMSLTLSCYNIYDFGNSINEYCFNDGLNDGRADMVLNIPRGLIITYQLEL